MGIFGRMADVLKSNVNDLIDNAENPEKLLKQIIREIEDNIDKSKQETAKILAEAKRLEKEVDVKAKAVDEWTKRAEMAVDNDDDDLARKAIERKKLHGDELETLSRRMNETQSAVEQMKQNTQLLKEKLSEARAKHTSLSARSSAAQTAKKVQKQVAELSDPSKVLGKFEKLERRVEDMESEASAMADVNAATDELEREFVDKEKNLEVDSELAALKAKRKKSE